MKIVHIAPNAPYNEGWSYQENILPKYQAKLGHEVLLVITNQEHKDGRIVETVCSDGITQDGFRVIRRKQERIGIPVLNRVLTRMPVYDILKKERPDFIFYHGLVSATIFDVCRYKREINPACVIVQDNHMDENNCPNVNKVKHEIVRIIRFLLFQVTRKYISKVYGVTPCREKFAQKYFGVPERMTNVLIMGADDSKIDITNKSEIRKRIRENNGFSQEDFLIVTGGKIDKQKRIHLLMKAVNEMPGVKLLVFGSVQTDVEKEFTEQLSDKVQWTGFIPSDDAYNYFLSADLVVFPGLHSVLWEQACACKVPCVFTKLEGMEHVNHGGNAVFIDDVSTESIKRSITDLIRTDAYYEMKAVAESEKTDIYLYSNIAKKSLECARGE